MGVQLLKDNCSLEVGYRLRGDEKRSKLDAF